MIGRHKIGLLAGLLVLCAGAMPAHAEVIFPPGLRIGLEPPPGMTVSKQFAGFADVERKVSITILDLPARVYPEIEKTIMAPDVKEPGITVQKRESFTFKSGSGNLVAFKVEAGGNNMQKWFLLANSSGPVTDLVTLITVEVPDAARASYPEAVIRKALSTVTFRPMPIQEQLGMLPYTLGDLSGFRVVRALPSGGVILTDGPSDDATEQAHIIISVGSGGPAENSDRANFARQMLSTTPFPGLTVTSSEAMRIGGAAGHEIRAKAKDARGGELALVQWVRFGGGGFLRVMAITRADDWDKMFTRFRAVRDGIEPR